MGEEVTVLGADPLIRSSKSSTNLPSALEATSKGRIGEKAGLEKQMTRMYVRGSQKGHKREQKRQSGTLSRVLNCYGTFRARGIKV